VPPGVLAQRLAGTAEGEGGEEEEEEDMGLILRTMSPCGSRHRGHLDLGHFSRLRPSELPRLAHTQPNTHRDTDPDPDPDPHTDPDADSDPSYLHSLTLADSLLTAPGLSRVLLSLAQSQPQGNKQPAIFQHLRRLDLSGNKVGDQGVRLLGDALSSGCPCLADVSVRGNGVSDAGAIELLQSILEGGGGPSLLKLDLGGNQLDLSAPRLVELLRLLPGLRVLDLSWNLITLPTFQHKALAKALLPACPALRVLSVSYNRMGDAGVCLLLTAAMQAPLLQLLDLAYCFCTDKAVDPLLALLAAPQKQAGASLVLLHGVALPLSRAELVLRAAQEGGRRVVLEGHHTGVSINMKYR
jgi:hypothetical protein